VQEDQEDQSAQHCQPLDLYRMDHRQHVSAAVAFGSVIAIGSRVSKAWTKSAIAAIPCCIRSSVVSVDARDLRNISFMDVVVLSNVSFMDVVNDSIMCIISLNYLSVTKVSSSSSGSCCGGCFLRGMVSGIENVAAAG
jgi:hypothetical protein